MSDSRWPRGRLDGPSWWGSSGPPQPRGQSTGYVRCGRRVERQVLRAEQRVALAVHLGVGEGGPRRRRRFGRRRFGRRRRLVLGRFPKKKQTNNQTTKTTKKNAINKLKMGPADCSLPRFVPSFYLVFLLPSLFKVRGRHQRRDWRFGFMASLDWLRRIDSILGSTGFYRVLLGLHWLQLGYTGFIGGYYGFKGFLPDFTEFYRVLSDFYWVLLG